MALPSSGQISFNDVRTEMSQSSKSNYEMSGWVGGIFHDDLHTYTPINILSSGSGTSGASSIRWEDTPSVSQPKKIPYESNYSMSAWYEYDRNLYIETNTTGTLYNHVKVGDEYNEVQTMLPINIGITNKRIVINWSGSLLEDTVDMGGAYRMDAWYGKPWFDNGGFIQRANGFGSTPAQHVTWSYHTTDVDGVAYFGGPVFTYEWDYEYDSNLGDKLYIVLSAKIEQGLFLSQTPGSFGCGHGDDYTRRLYFTGSFDDVTGTFFLDAEKTTYFNGNNLWYGVSPGSISVKIGTIGQLLEVAYC